MTSTYIFNPCYSNVTLSNITRVLNRKIRFTNRVTCSISHDYVTNTNGNVINHISVSPNIVITENKLKIAMVGFGKIGQFLAKEMVNQGHQVLAYSPSDYSKVANDIGVKFFNSAHDLCEEHPEVVLLCTPILSTETVFHSLPINRLQRSTLFVDTLAVKEFPRKLFLQHLPRDFDILCTHPMFGPNTSNSNWAGFPYVFDKIRVGSEQYQINRIGLFLDIFRKAECKMIEMTCEEHDKHACGTQFITYLMGRILDKAGFKSTSINTKGYKTLLDLMDSSRDNLDLLYGLFLYNKNAIEHLHRFEWAFEMVEKELSFHLHEKK